jgi:hypothetical protein
MTTHDPARIYVSVAASGKHLLSGPETGDGIAADIIQLYLRSGDAFVSCSAAASGN